MCAHSSLTNSDVFILLRTTLSTHTVRICPFALGSWSEVSQLIEDDLLSKEEVVEMFRDLPNAGEGASIDLKGFVEFATKVNVPIREAF